MVFQSAKIREKAKKTKPIATKSSAPNYNYLIPTSNYIETQAYQQQQEGFSSHGNRN